MNKKHVVINPRNWTPNWANKNTYTVDMLDTIERTQQDANASNVQFRLWHNVLGIQKGLVALNQCEIFKINKINKNSLYKMAVTNKTRWHLETTRMPGFMNVALSVVDHIKDRWLYDEIDGKAFRMACRNAKIESENCGNF